MPFRTQFSPLLAPGLASIFYRNLRDRSSEHEAFITVKKSRRAYEEEYKLAGLGRMFLKPEGTAYRFDEPLPGDTIRYTHLTYGLGFRITQEMLEDDLYGVMNRMSAELARSARINREVQGFAPLNNAFNSSFTGFDGVELCSNSHPLLGGGTGDNLVTGDFDLPALQAAIELFEGWTDDRDVPIEMMPKMLIHNTQDIWIVGETLESEYRPTDADNAINVVRSKYGITPKCVHWLTDTDSWFLLAAKGMHDMKMWLRVSDEFRNSDDPITGDAIFTARHRLSTGFGDWRGVVGSAGA